MEKMNASKGKGQCLVYSLVLAFILVFSSTVNAASLEQGYLGTNATTVAYEVNSTATIGQDNINCTAEMGNTFTDDSSEAPFYIKLQLTNANFTNDPNLWITNSSGGVVTNTNASNVEFVTRSGGTAKFKLTSSDASSATWGTIESSGNTTIELNGGVEPTNGKTDISLEKGVYLSSFASDPISGTVKSGKIIDYASTPSFNVNVDASDATGDIDILNNRDTFTSNDSRNTTIGNVELKDIDATVYNASGATLGAADIVLNNTMQVYAPAHNPGDQVNGTEFNATGYATKTEITQNTYDIEFQSNENASANIQPQQFTATVTPKVKDIFSNPYSNGVQSDISRIDLNGATAVLNFSLTPKSEGGVYRNYIRITNTGTIDSDVDLQLINDSGKRSEVFALSDVTDKNKLAADASTNLIQIGDIYDEAPADFDLGDKGNKLRLEATIKSQGIKVQSLAVSKDNTSLSILSEASDNTTNN